MRFPVKVGDTWTFIRKVPNAPNVQEPEHGSGRVLAYEPLTVPAGTFDCFRHDIESSFNARLYIEERLYRRWYCPKLKWIAKEIVETRVFSPAGPLTRTITTSELVTFKLAD
jgi:hypothetical protein